MHDLILRELSPSDESSFLRWMDDWEGEDPSWATFAWTKGMSHEEHLRCLADQKDKSKLPPERVPGTMLYGWVDEEIVGRFNVRHELNTSLLRRGGHIGYAVSPRFRKRGYGSELMRKGLTFCRTLGLRRLLVTCAEDNRPSWLIIEKFGGVLENKFEDQNSGDRVRRYWLELV